MRHLQNTDLCLQTIRKHIRHLNTLFTKLGPPGPRNRNAYGFLPIAPWIRPPRDYRKLPREIVDLQAERLYAAVETTPECFLFPKYLEDRLRPTWWKTLFLFVSTTGLRRGVVFSLTWDDLDISQRRIAISSRIDKSRCERIRPLHPFVLQELRAIQSSVETENRLFPWTHGNKKFDEIIGAINVTAGIIPKITLHDLKRYALQSALRAGCDASTLQMLGDHSSFRTTQQHYIRGNLDKYIETARLPGCEQERKR